MLNINILKRDFEEIEKLNNKENKTEMDLHDGYRYFDIFASFIETHPNDFKKFKGSDVDSYISIDYWVDRQRGVVSNIKKHGFKKTIDSVTETEADWIIYEAWLLGFLIRRYCK